MTWRLTLFKMGSEESESCHRLGEVLKNARLRVCQKTFDACRRVHCIFTCLTVQSSAVLELSELVDGEGAAWSIQLATSFCYLDILEKKKGSSNLLINCESLIEYGEKSQHFNSDRLRRDLQSLRSFAASTSTPNQLYILAQRPK